MTVGRELISALETIGGPIEWYRCVTAHSPQDAKRPPLTVWRYVDADPELNGRLVREVENFRGAVKWIASDGGTRNWVIQPESVAAHPRRNEFRTDVEFADAFFLEHPDTVQAAFADLPRLAEHLLVGLGQLRGGR